MTHTRKYNTVLKSVFRLCLAVFLCVLFRVSVIYCIFCVFGFLVLGFFLGRGQVIGWKDISKVIILVLIGTQNLIQSLTYDTLTVNWFT